MLKEKFQKEQGEGDWRIPIKETLVKRDDTAELKILKDYALVKEELYRRMPGGILSRCVGQEEAQRKLRKYPTRPVGPAGKSVFTADSRE